MYTFKKTLKRYQPTENTISSKRW